MVPGTSFLRQNHGSNQERINRQKNSVFCELQIQNRLSKCSKHSVKNRIKGEMKHRLRVCSDFSESDDQGIQYNEPGSVSNKVSDIRI